MATERTGSVVDTTSMSPRHGRLRRHSGVAHVFRWIALGMATVLVAVVGASAVGLVSLSAVIQSQRVAADREHRMAELITATPLIETELTLACSADHPLAGREAIDPADLLDWPWVLPAPDTNNRMSLEAGFRNCGLTPPRPTVEMSADPNALMALALRGEVLTCVPRMALRGFGSSGLLVPVNVPRLRLLPVLTSFLTLAENDALPPLRMLKEAFVRAVRQAGATRNQLPLV